MCVCDGDGSMLNILGVNVVLRYLIALRRFGR
jgi:hypothetical protein